MLKIIFRFRFDNCGITDMAYNQQDRLDALLTIFPKTNPFILLWKRICSEMRTALSYTHADIRLALFLSSTC